LSECLTEFNKNTEKLGEKDIKINDIKIKPYKDIKNREIFLNNPWYKYEPIWK